MPRASSATDMAVLTSLATRGIRVSAYQLERWRTRGLAPRNARHGLGRGRGTSSAAAPDLAACLETVAMASTRGADVEQQILMRLHDVAGSVSGQSQLAQLAERPIRACLEYAVLRDRPSTINDDDAYREAASIATTDFAAWLPQVIWREPAPQYRAQEVAEMHAACQQILAADRIGVAEVGTELVLESVKRLRWARSDEEAVTLVDYLDRVLNRQAEHLDLARNAPYDRVLLAAASAVRVANFAHTFPDRLQDSAFSWLPFPHPDYTRWSVLLMAMLMDPSLVAAERDFLDSHPEDPILAWHRQWLERHVAHMRERFPEGIPPDPTRTAPVGLDEFLDRQTGKWH